MQYLSNCLVYVQLLKLYMFVFCFLVIDEDVSIHAFFRFKLNHLLHFVFDL